MVSPAVADARADVGAERERADVDAPLLKRGVNVALVPPPPGQIVGVARRRVAAVRARA